MSNISRMLIAMGSLALIMMYFVPAWSIYLVAPQYPEGLSMQIWLNNITGQVEIINGLNHYIGMKHINASMFPEFGFLIYILGFFILFGLVVAVTGNRNLLFGYLILSVLGGIAAMVDFYLWGYDYGHDLDPTAAIQVPGLTYQPPLIGHKKLLNFDSYSYPDVGGWIVIAVTGLFFLIWFLEYRKNKNPINILPVKRNMKAVMVPALLLLFSACSVQSEKISIGKDQCVECRMTIMDPKFGAEVVTKKGRIYKFDDPHCLAAFLNKRTVELSEIDQTLVVNYKDNNDFVNIQEAEFVVSSKLKSPMNGNAAAFKNVSVAKSAAAEIAGSRVTNWATLYNILIK